MNWLCCTNCKSSTSEDVTELDYSHSLLKDVPSDIFCHERTLEKLYLDSNRIVELPKQLFNCDELRILTISDNDINFLPPAVSLLINLQKLDLSKNSIMKIPENIKRCRNLSVLDLGINPLEKFPESLTNLISLTELYLNDVYLEFLPANLGKLVNLRYLELRENNLNTLPRTINKLLNLTRLDIGNNEFSELPDIVSTLHNLTELWIDGNNIRRLHSSIGQLRRLTHFEASNNKIEKLPAEIGLWTRMIELGLSGNDLTEIPDSIAHMRYLVTLKLDDNQLTQLPETIGKLTNLEELMINYNYINNIPSSVGLLRKLQVVIADRNKLANIPPEIGSCISLAILSLRDNRLSEIPAEIGHINSLRVLNLVNNQLKHLPISLLKLDKLSALWLSNNQSQPLVPLQQESSPNFQMVLTCFMLPQVSHNRLGDFVRETNGSSTHSGQNRKICFADEPLSVEHKHRLLRAPTPYPKELRVLAKQAKNLQKLASEASTSHVEDEVQPIQDPLEIKEAKVSTTCQNKISENPKPLTEEVTVQPEPSCSPSTSYRSIDPPNKYPEKCAMPLPVITVRSNAVIRTATTIKTETQGTPPLTPKTGTINKPKDIKTDIPLEPPPYHIAAARSQFYNAREFSESLPIQSLSPTQSQVDNNEHSDVNYNKNIDTSNEEKKINIQQKISNLDLQNANYEDTTYYAKSSEMDNVTYKNYFINMQNNDDKPRTFIQDKPSPSQYIVAPTPKRPVSTENPIPYLNTSKSGGSPDKSNSIKWAFGPHKNATVLQVTVQRGPELGFTICQKKGFGIFVDSVHPDGPAANILRIGDKVLEAEGVDFTEISEEQAINTLLATNAFINMMISHMD